MKELILATMMCTMLVVAGNAWENTKTFPAAGITSVNIRTRSAPIYVVSTQTAVIQVEQMPDNVRVCDVTMEVVDGNLVLKAMDKKGEFEDIKTGIRVQLPAGIRITADTKFGDIDFHNIAGAIGAKTISGGIKLDNVSGSIKAITISGNITGAIKLSEASKDITFKTLSGNISVTFPYAAAIAVDAATISGRMHNDFSASTGLPVTARTKSGNISITKAGKL